MAASKLVDKHGKFTVVPNRFIKDTTISHEAFRLYVVLRLHVNTSADEEQAFPSYELLKKETSIKHNKTIANSLRELEAKGWIDRKRRFSSSTIYTLTIPSSSDVMENPPITSSSDAPLSHAVTQQCVIPQKTNKTNLTRRTSNKTKKIAATAAPLESSPQIQSPIEPEGDTQNGNASPLRQSPIDDDVPPAPPPPVVKPAKAPRPPDPVFDRLCTMTESVAAIDGGMIGKTRQTINKDDKHPCTVANLDLFMLWWCSADNWRKKSSAVPELKQMPGLWGKAMAWAEKHAPKPAPIVEQLSPEDAAALEAKLMAEYEANEAERTRRRIAAGYIKA